MNYSGMTTMEVKKINRNSVYQVIYTERSISKQMISQKLNMGLTTVTQNLKELEDQGWICRTGYYESTGGRKAQTIEIVRNAKTAIGIFILKKSILFAATNLYGEMIKKHTVERNFESTDEYYKFLGREVMRFANSVESNPDKISGVGIAIQGIVDSSGNVVQYGKLLSHASLQVEDLARYIPYDCILEHDSKAAAFAEIWSRPDISDATVLLLNKNLGSAIIVNGEIHFGKNMHSGTVEHMSIVPDGKPCYCGGTGCLETCCSAEALQSAIAPASFQTFFDAVHANDKNCQEIWHAYLSYLSISIRNILTVIDSDIIIGGILAPYFTDGDISLLQAKIKSVPFFTDRTIKIYVGQNGEFAPALGASLHFVKKSLFDI